MRKNLMAAGIAVAALIPTFALAQQTCEQRRDNRVAGTVIGGLAGALLGNAVSSGGGKTGGTIIGAGVGAVAGNQIAKGSGDCVHAYGYYDTNGMWHANAVARADARGYYDRNGNWVEGAPTGYYDSRGNWIANNTSASAAGYYDAGGRWVPASANGYYDANGNWIGGMAAGYYSNGRWIAGPATGHYDRDGRWISGAPAGHRDANGMWVADAQPGYYDSNGRWRAGPVMGYYDAQGRWYATAPSAGAYGANVNYQSRPDWNGAPADVRAREAWLSQRIQRGMNDGSLSPREGRRALHELTRIRNDEAVLRRSDGRLRGDDEARIQARLDDLSSSVRWSRQN